MKKDRLHEVKAQLNAVRIYIGGNLPIVPEDLLEWVVNEIDATRKERDAEKELHGDTAKCLQLANEQYKELEKERDALKAELEAVKIANVKVIGNQDAKVIIKTQARAMTEMKQERDEARQEALEYGASCEQFEAELERESNACCAYREKTTLLEKELDALRRERDELIEVKQERDDLQARIDEWEHMAQGYEKERDELKEAVELATNTVKILMTERDEALKVRDRWKDGLERKVIEWNELEDDYGLLLEVFHKTIKERDALQHKLDTWECHDETGMIMAKLKQENTRLREALTDYCVSNDECGDCSMEDCCHPTTEEQDEKI